MEFIPENAQNGNNKIFKAVNKAYMRKTSLAIYV